MIENISSVFFSFPFLQADVLLSRHSSEDVLYALFFVLHGLGPIELDLVRYSVNPSWEKSWLGVPGLGNVLEFAKMIR